MNHQLSYLGTGKLYARCCILAIPFLCSVTFFKIQARGAAHEAVLVRYEVGEPVRLALKKAREARR